MVLIACTAVLASRYPYPCRARKLGQAERSNRNSGKYSFRPSSVCVVSATAVQRITSNAALYMLLVLYVSYTAAACCMAWRGLCSGAFMFVATLLEKTRLVLAAPGARRLAWQLHLLGPIWACKLYPSVWQRRWRSLRRQATC